MYDSEINESRFIGKSINCVNTYTVNTDRYREGESEGEERERQRGGKNYLCIRLYIKILIIISLLFFSSSPNANSLLE